MLLTTTWVQVGLATSLVVSPATPEDWTVLKLNRRKVEREVLDQVWRCIEKDFNWGDFQGQSRGCGPAVEPSCGSGKGLYYENPPFFPSWLFSSQEEGKIFLHQMVGD